VHAPGFAPTVREVAIEATTGQRAAELPRVELAAEAVVEGVVVDGRGDPVQGARIARERVPTYLAVGAAPAGVAVTDARGRFRLGELVDGTAALEAFAPDVGRGRAEGVRVTAGRTTDGVRIALRASPDERTAEPASSGGVAVTLGLTNADEVVLVSVADASAAERAGLVPGDVIVEVDGTKVVTIAAARARLSGPLADDVVVKLRRGERALALRVPREPVRR
jgi:membrane-associated protease RseP (regulator of RpoE activity)